MTLNTTNLGASMPLPAKVGSPFAFLQGLPVESSRRTEVSLWQRLLIFSLKLDERLK
jgi:hypothetical protein